MPDSQLFIIENSATYLFHVPNQIIHYYAVPVVPLHAHPSHSLKGKNKISRCSRRKHPPKTNVVVTIGGVVAAAKSNAAIARIVVPQAAPQNANSVGIVAHAAAARIALVPIGAPFIQVASHIVQSQLVGLFRAHGVRSTLTTVLTALKIATIPCHIANIVAPRILVAIGLMNASARRVFPLGLRGQAVAVSVLLAV